MARLRRHPQLYEPVNALLDEVENRAGALDTADQAEDARSWHACASSAAKR